MPASGTGDVSPDVYEPGVQHISLDERRRSERAAPESFGCRQSEVPYRLDKSEDDPVVEDEARCSERGEDPEESRDDDRADDSGPEAGAGDAHSRSEEAPKRALFADVWWHGRAPAF